MNLRFSKVAKERVAPHGNLLAAIGTTLASAYSFLRGDMRTGTDFANIAVLTFKTWLLPYVENGRNINYFSIIWNLLDSALMEGASQVWGVPFYRGTHIITAGEIAANITELYHKRGQEVDPIEKNIAPDRISNISHAPDRYVKFSSDNLTKKLYL